MHVRPPPGPPGGSGQPAGAAHGGRHPGGSAARAPPLPVGAQSQLNATEAKQLAELARKGGDLTTASKYEAEFKKLHAQESPKPPTPLHQRVQQQFAAVARLEKALDREVDKLLGWRNDAAKLEDT
eukprot:3247022-Pyramimonas_sp.AAC.1